MNPKFVHDPKCSGCPRCQSTMARLLRSAPLRRPLVWATWLQSRTASLTPKAAQAVLRRVLGNARASVQRPLSVPLAKGILGNAAPPPPPAHGSPNEHGVPRPPSITDYRPRPTTPPVDGRRIRKGKEVR